MPDSAPPIAAPPNPADSQRYAAALGKDTGALQASLASFQGKHVVLVRGFLTDLLDRTGDMMTDQIEAVRRLGSIAHKVPNFDSENPPDVNAAAIAKTVTALGSKVVLLTHSKGSVDTLTALVNYPKMRDQVEGWVSIQGAVQGSAVADYLAGKWEHPILEAVKRQTLAALFEHLFHGSIRSLDALRTRDRVDYLTASRNEIAKITSQIPIVAFGSAAPTRRSILRTITDPFFTAEPHNDGLMAVARTAIPGARVLHDLDGPDHADAVTDVPGPQSWDRVRLTYALLSLL
jgi:hypothetical protein